MTPDLGFCKGTNFPIYRARESVSERRREKKDEKFKVDTPLYQKN